MSDPVNLGRSRLYAIQQVDPTTGRTITAYGISPGWSAYAVDDEV